MKVEMIRIEGKEYEEYSFEARGDHAQAIIDIGLAEGTTERNTWYMSVMEECGGHCFWVDEQCVQKILEITKGGTYV
jgi:hypothetical protein